MSNFPLPESDDKNVEGMSKRSRLTFLTDKDVQTKKNTACWAMSNFPLSGGDDKNLEGMSKRSRLTFLTDKYIVQ